MRIATILFATLTITARLFAAETPAKPARPNADDLKKISEALPATAPAKPLKERKVLVFTKATGFVHSSIPVGAKTFELMGQKTGAFSTVISDDPEAFSPEKLRDFDAILMLSTTGSLFVPKGAKENLLYDAKAELPADLKRAKELRDSLLNFVKSGKGIMGIHAATDSSYQWKEYGTMMGGYFNGHPWGKITLFIDDPTNPVNAAFEGKPFTISDEIYTFKETYSRDRMHILASIDVEATKLDGGFNRPDHDYGVSWLNRFGEGRAFYCSLGHAEATYWNPVVLKHYLAGLQYALGDLKVADAPSGAIAPERTAAGERLAAMAWKSVSSNEAWYKDKKDVKEQSHTGILQANPKAGEIGIVQRTSHYTLDDRTVFTGGKKHPALDALVGKKVEIRGKAVDMELEGKALKEIWPASVRPAQEAKPAK